MRLASVLTPLSDYNLRLGGAYLRSMLRRYGEPALAFAAYNAGPSRIDSWLDLHGDPRGKDRHALIDWIELIPFDETRNYVQRVSENLRVYEQRLAGADPLPVVPRPVIGPVWPPPWPSLRPPPAEGTVSAPSAEPAPEEPDSTIIKASFSTTPVPWRKPPSGAPPPLPALKPGD